MDFNRRSILFDKVQVEFPAIPVEYLSKIAWHVINLRIYDSRIKRQTYQKRVTASEGLEAWKEVFSLPGVEECAITHKRRML